MELPREWVERLRVWNEGHPNHPPLMIRWEPQALQRRVYVWVHGVSVPRWAYVPRWVVGVKLPHVPEGLEKVSSYIKGSGGDYFVKLFTWMDQGTEEFLHLDDRIFGCLGDMTKHQFYERVIEAPEVAREESEYRDRRAMGAATAAYYKGHDNPIVSMDPTVKAGAGWRWRTR